MDLKAPKRYKNPRLQEIFEASFHFSKKYCLDGGGALQCAWKAGYLGEPMGRHGGSDYTSITAITYRAGQARKKAEETDEKQKKQRVGGSKCITI